MYIKMNSRIRKLSYSTKKRNCYVIQDLTHRNYSRTVHSLINFDHFTFGPIEAVMAVSEVKIMNIA